VPPPPAQADNTPAPARQAQASPNGAHWTAQERLWENEHQSAEQAVALVERDQRISALRAEKEWLASQLDEERTRREALEPELDGARGHWAAAEKRAADFEAGFHETALRLQNLKLTVDELTAQLELVKSERNDAVYSLARHQESVAELTMELDKARGERKELDQILGRAREHLDQTTSELAAAQSSAGMSAAEMARLKASVATLSAELRQAVAERDELQGLVRDDHDLAEFVAVKTERDRIDTELKETQAREESLAERIESLASERESLKRERTELQLKVAALRDAHDDTQLQQDNEVLRRMVERLNEELKDLQPEIAKRKRRAAPGGVVGGLARAAMARCFVPDADVAEGR